MPTTEDEEREPSSQRQDLRLLVDAAAVTQRTSTPQSNASLIDIVSSQPQQPAPPKQSTSDLLMDLLSTSSAPIPQQVCIFLFMVTMEAIPVVAAQAISSASDPRRTRGYMTFCHTADALPQLVVYDKNGLGIVFDFVKHPSNVSMTQINASFSNSLSFPLVDFVFQAAVPKVYFTTWSSQFSTSSCSSIRLHRQLSQLQRAALSLRSCGFKIRCTGRSKALRQLVLTVQKPTLMKVKIDYKVNGSAVTDQFDVSNFPASV